MWKTKLLTLILTCLLFPTAFGDDFDQDVQLAPRLNELCAFLIGKAQDVNSNVDDDQRSDNSWRLIYNQFNDLMHLLYAGLPGGDLSTILRQSYTPYGTANPTATVLWNPGPNDRTRKRQIENAMGRLYGLNAQLDDRKPGNRIVVKEVAGAENIIAFLDDMESKRAGINDELEDMIYQDESTSTAQGKQFGRQWLVNKFLNPAQAAIFAWWAYTSVKYGVLQGDPIILMPMLPLLPMLARQAVNTNYLRGFRSWIPGRTQTNARTEVENELGYRGTDLYNFLKTVRFGLEDGSISHNDTGYFGQSMILSSAGYKLLNEVSSLEDIDAQTLANLESSYMELFTEEDAQRGGAMAVDLILKTDSESGIPSLLIITRISDEAIPRGIKPKDKQKATSEKPVAEPAGGIFAPGLVPIPVRAK